MSIYLLALLWGLPGAGINASFRLYTALCEGETSPTSRGRQAAWTQFVIAILTGEAMAAALTPWLMGLAHAPCPPIAVTVGLAGNVIAVAVRDTVGARIAAVITALFGNLPPKANP